jgi:hypothetical protein
MQLIRKISTATIYGGKLNVQRAVAEAPGTVDLYSVYGRANGVVRGKSKFTDNGENREDEWMGFVGQFEAVHAETGEIVRSGKCFLPQYAAEIVAGQFGEDAETVTFGFVVCAEKDDSSAVGYTYSVRPLIDTSGGEDDPLLELRGEVSKAISLEDKRKSK